MLEIHHFGILKISVTKEELIHRLLPTGQIKLNLNHLPNFLVILSILWQPLLTLQVQNYPDRFNNQEITPMQGQSLLPVFMGKTHQREKPIFWEWSDGQAVYFDSFKIVKEGINKSMGIVQY